jgi:segregation and condensation protein B
MTHLSDTAAQAQAFLLAEGGPIPFKKLAQLLHADEASARAALVELSAALEGSGLALVEADYEVSLATAPRVASALRQAFEDSLAREIGAAGLEVLAIVLYRGASTRAAIDYIRGVNTSSTVRLLLSRGLLERVSNPNDAREYLYRSTAELLAHLGVRSAQELPDYGTIRAELQRFEEAQTAFDNHAATTADESR